MNPTDKIHSEVITPGEPGQQLTTEKLHPAQYVAQPLATREPSTGELLAAVITQGITAASVEVIERLCALKNKEQAALNKSEFNRAFFAMKKELAGLEFYLDKAAKTKSGAVAYQYCSETEISEKLEPLLFKHGFAMLFGQRQDGERVSAEITLIHESGHEEKREYTVTRGRSNDMKDATAVDASATTSAWRHLVIKLFGLKSRIREEDDARNVGEHITREKAEELYRRVLACGGNPKQFLAFAHALAEDQLTGEHTFETIGTARLESVEKMLCAKERKAAQKPADDLGKENKW